MRQQLKRLENCAQRDDGWLTVKPQLIAIVAAAVLVGCAKNEITIANSGTNVWQNIEITGGG